MQLNEWKSHVLNESGAIDESLGPDYKAPIRLTTNENEMLSWFYQGQGDPLYALVSRTTRGKETKASSAEIDSAMSAIKDALKLRGGDQLSRSGMKEMQSLYKKLKALGKKHYPEDF